MAGSGRRLHQRQEEMVETEIDGRELADLHRSSIATNGAAFMPDD
jgi:hypothetical protein